MAGSRMHHLRRLLMPVVLPTLLTASACEIPRFEGPQIQNPPPAFTMKDDVYQQRRMFNDQAIVHHSAWVEASYGNFSGIYINGHAGVMGSGEVEAARSAAIDAARGALAEFGELERLTVDGRTAWGWGETWRLPNGGLQYVTFRVAVPYDTITYAIDLVTGDPGMKSRPDSLRRVAASFAIGKTRWNLPLIAVVAGLALFAGGAARSRARARAEATRRITLVKVPKKEEAPKAAAGTEPRNTKEPPGA